VTNRPPDPTAVALARLEGKFDEFVENLERRLDRIEAKQDLTNGRVTKLEAKEIARATAEETREQTLEAVKDERQESRASRFAWIAAAGTVGGLITGAAALIGSSTAG
jgi:predicted ribosome quality control (RQC) complex YloA/Tae2 family protein